MELLTFSNMENSLVSTMAIYVMSLLAVYIISVTYFFLRRLRIREVRPQAALIRELHGTSHHLVKSMTSNSFTAAHEDNASVTCAICLEDCNLGENLRILPCCHRFHAICVDVWLTRRTLCPVCKRDAITGSISITIDVKPTSQSIRLLSSGPCY